MRSGWNPAGLQRFRRGPAPSRVPRRGASTAQPGTRAVGRSSPCASAGRASPTTRPHRYRAIERLHTVGTELGVSAGCRSRGGSVHHPGRGRGVASGSAAPRLLAVRRHRALRHALHIGRDVTGSGTGHRPEPDQASQVVARYCACACARGSGTSRVTRNWPRA